MIELVDVSYTYPDGQVALRGVSATIASGEKAALVGPNGAGKTTLLLHLNGIFRGEGEVRIAGVTVNDDNLPTVRRMVGMVFDQPDDQLFSPTVYDDVAFGPMYMDLPEREVHSRVEAALEQVGMAGAGDRLSHHLSAGEKKRVAIATVLSMQPEILVLDEPTMGLDPRGRRELIQYLQGLRQTLVVSTHDMAFVAEITNRTLIMDQGHLIKEGPTEEVFSQGPLLERHGLERPGANPWDPSRDKPTADIGDYDGLSRTR